MCDYRTTVMSCHRVGKQQPMLCPIWILPKGFILGLWFFSVDKLFFTLPKLYKMFYSHKHCVLQNINNPYFLLNFVIFFSPISVSLFHTTYISINRYMCAWFEKICPKFWKNVYTQFWYRWQRFLALLSSCKNNYLVCNRNGEI